MTGTTWREEAAARKAAAQAVVDRLGLNVVAEFVPFSKSRNAKPNPKASCDIQLNWRVTLRCRERDVLTTDYQAGIAHCPSYKQSMGGGFTQDEWDAILFECECGKAARPFRNIGYISGGAPILPDPLDVLYSIAMDSDAIDFTFEDWAGNYGFDPDSRRAEAIYKVCLDHAIRLRQAVGDDGLRQLREAFQDY